MSAADNQTRPAWAVALVPAIREIDGGCTTCIRAFLEMAAQAHPGVDWDGLVWEATCLTCGQVVPGESPGGGVYCDAHRPLAVAPTPQMGHVVASAWERVIESRGIADVFASDIFRGTLG